MDKPNHSAYEAPTMKVVGTLQSDTLLRGKSVGSPHDGDFIKGQGYLTTVS
jgi:hypothetical protein